MARLPVCSGKEAVRVFGRLGWKQVRQSASHIVLYREGASITLSVPDHKELDRGTLRG
jgi:predicted RNA binding protein YcfA (HicA-like mRNA interferase family)